MDVILTHVHFGETDRPPGYEERFLRLMDEGGVSRTVIFANDLPGETTNECVAALVRRYPQRLYGTAEVNVADRAVRKHMRDHVRKNGMCGFKLFPSKCLCYPDDKRMFPIYETAVELDVPMVIHAGRVPPDFAAYGLNKYGQPIYLDEVAARFPDLRIVVSHSGNPLFEQTLMIGRRPNVFIEMTGTGTWKLDDGYQNRLYALYGADRIIGGGPLHEHARSIPHHARTVIEDLRRRKLSEEDIAKIMGGNAARVFKLPPWGA